MPEVMTDSQVQEKLKEMLVESKAWLEGHFKLTSGRHSGNYMQCAMLLRFPKYAAFTGGEIAKRIAALKPDFIVSPALGGLIIGHEVARALDVPFLFCEREDGRMKLRVWAGSACIVDRSGGAQQLGPDLVSLFKISFPTWEADDCPLCRELGTPPVKPGSRPGSK